MALTSCRECGQQVSTEAATCPHCGVADPAGVAAAKKEQDVKKKRSGCLGYVALFFVLLVIGTIISALPGGEDSPDAAPDPVVEHSQVEAYGICRQFVRDRLKAPRTAKFPSGGSEGATHMGDGKYVVRSYVDAENSFGAMLRNHFVCTVQWTGGDSWRLEDLKMD